MNFEIERSVTNILRFKNKTRQNRCWCPFLSFAFAIELFYTQVHQPNVWTRDPGGNDLNQLSISSYFYLKNSNHT